MTAFRWCSACFAVLAAAIGAVVLVIALRGERQQAARPFVPRHEQTDAGRFVIGLAPERNLFEQRERHQAIRQYLSEQLGAPIRFRSLLQYQTLIEEMRDGRVEGAFLGSYTYVLAHQIAGATIIARPVWKDGSSHYRGLLFAASRLGRIEPASMKGLRLALVSKATTAGYLFPVHYFRRHGVPDMGAHFRDVYYTGSHDSAVWMVAHGDADVGACKSPVYDALVRSHPELKQKLVVLAQSEPVPSNGLAVTHRVGPGIRMKLRQILLDMNNHEAGRRALDAFGASKFVSTTDADYAPVYSMVAEAGVQLELIPQPASRHTHP